MTANQWLLFVGVPALFAVVAIIVDWRAVRRRRIGTANSRTFRHDYELRGVHGSLQPGTDVGLAKGTLTPPEAPTHSQPPMTEQTDPLAKLAKLAKLIESTPRNGAEGRREK